MDKSLLGPDRVVLLLALIPYLREHGPTSVAELSATFNVSERTMRKLISFLGTAGIPGETLAYQHNDLFDIDWDAFLDEDIVSLTHTVAIDDTPRFTGAESAALLAGLHELAPLLPEADAIIARDLAARLSTAFSQRETASVSSDATVRAEISVLVEAIEQRRTVHFTYVGRSGEASPRRVDPRALFERQGSWYLTGLNHERGAERTFRVDLMRDCRLGDEFEERELAAAKRSTQEDLIATVPERLLPVLRGFEPRTIGPAGDGLVRIRIAAWHPGAAVRLVQHAPGEIVVESPAEARSGIASWAAEALAASRSSCN